MKLKRTQIYEDIRKIRDILHECMEAEPGSLRSIKFQQCIIKLGSIETRIKYIQDIKKSNGERLKPKKQKLKFPVII